MLFTPFVKNVPSIDIQVFITIHHFAGFCKQWEGGMCECTLYFAGRLLYDGERKNKNRNGDEHRVYKQLCKISGEENVLRDEPMKKHTTFRIGGPRIIL